jgi:hypothetical protein
VCGWSPAWRAPQWLSKARRQLRPAQGLLCDAFTKAGNGDWVATKDVMVPGPSGMVLIKAGVPVDDEMQERLDDRCGTGKVLRPRQV